MSSRVFDIPACVIGVIYFIHEGNVGWAVSMLLLGCASLYASLESR